MWRGLKKCVIIVLTHVSGKSGRETRMEDIK